MKHLVLISLITMSLAAPIQSQQQPKDGDDLIHKMYEKYHNKWYSHLTFKHQTIYYKEGKVAKEETW